MPCMTQTSTTPLRAPHAPPISIRRPPRHHHSAQKPIPHPRSHPALPSPAEKNQGQPYHDVDAQDPGSPSSPPPPGPGAPPPHTGHRPRPRPPPSIPPRQGPDHPPGLVPPTRQLDQAHRHSPPGPDHPRQRPPRGHRLPRTLASPQTHPDQHVWIPPIEWGQALTHDTGINVTRRGTVRLRRAPAEMDHPADPNRPEQWEQDTAPNRDTALRATGLRTPDDDPPPHLQTVTTPCRRSGLQSSSVGTTT